MKAAIYARYSTDLQTEKSIEDQVALCRAFAARQGLAIVAVYEDRARSGASVLGRDGLMQMMDAARDSHFNCIVIESLDRLSRDQEDLAGIWKRMSFLGIDIRAVHEGLADAIQIGVRGLVGALYLQDLAHKVRRGLAGVVRSGRYAGGRAYGYRPIPGRAGEMEIVQEEALIVRRIFDEYGGGESTRRIVARLNAEKIDPPRGQWWGPSALIGSRKRGSGILANEIYVGRIVWNKVRMAKDPDTGKRVSRPNPVVDRQAVDAPSLAIVSVGVFKTVQERLCKRGHENKPTTRRAPRTLLSGLLKCGVCGSGMISHDRDKTGKARIRCSLAKQSASCDHARLYYREAVEAVVLDGLKAELESPALIAAYVKEYASERKRLAKAEDAAKLQRGRRLAEVKRSIGRLVDAIADGSAPALSVRDRLADLESEKSFLETPESSDKRAPALHPAAVTRYLHQIEELASEMKAEGTIAEGSPAAIFRELVESVIVHPVPARAPLDIEIRGRLAALLGDPKLPPLGRHSGFPGLFGGSGGGS